MTGQVCPALLLVLLVQVGVPVLGVELSVTSRCSFPIWLATAPNTGNGPLPGGSIRLDSGQKHTYQVPTWMLYFHLKYLPSRDRDTRLEWPECGMVIERPEFSYAPGYQSKFCKLPLFIFYSCLTL